MNLYLFLYIAAFFVLALGEFGQFPFGKTDFSISATDVLLTLGLSVALIWNIGIRKKLSFPRHFSYLLMFWAVCILSLLFSLDLSGWLYLVRFIIYAAVFYLTFQLVKSGILGLREFLVLLKLTCVILALTGLIQMFIFPDLEPLSKYGYDPHKYRLFSTFLDPNFLGTFLNFGFITLIYELISKKIISFKGFLKDNKWDIAAVIILGSAVILTFSRSAYLMLAVSLFIILAAKNRKLLIISAMVSVILYFTFPAFNQRIDGAIKIDASANERFSSWDKGLIIFQENPLFGVGFNNIRNYSQKMDLLKLFSPDGGNSGSGIDSSLIFILAATGLAGFISYVWFLIRVITDLFSSATSGAKTFYNLQFQPVKFLHRVMHLPGLSKWYREETSGKIIKNNPLSLTLLGLTLGLLANSFFINSLFFPPIMFLWFSLLGVFYGLGEGEVEGDAS